MPVESYIRLETEALPISATAAHHEIAVETSVDSGIDLSVSYGDEEGGAWIENLTLADGKLAFDAGENGSSERRIAVISLLYQDEFGRTTEAAVRITQSFSMNPSAATEFFQAEDGIRDSRRHLCIWHSKQPPRCCCGHNSMLARSAFSCPLPQDRL